MKRRLRSLVVAISLLLSIAATALWVRSYWRADCVTAWNTRGHVSAEARAGHLSVEVDNMYGNGFAVCRFSDGVGNIGSARQLMRRLSTWHVLDFYYWKDMRPGQNISLFNELTDRGLRTPAGLCRRDTLYVPFWFIVPLLAAPGLILWWKDSVPRRRRARGQCVGCGYDLRGSPGRCPECGREVDR